MLEFFSEAFLTILTIKVNTIKNGNKDDNSLGSVFLHSQFSGFNYSKSCSYLGSVCRKIVSFLNVFSQTAGLDSKFLKCFSPNPFSSKILCIPKVFYNLICISSEIHSLRQGLMCCIRKVFTSLANSLESNVAILKAHMSNKLRYFAWNDWKCFIES